MWVDEAQGMREGGVPVGGDAGVKSGVEAPEGEEGV